MFVGHELTVGLANDDVLREARNLTRQYRSFQSDRFMQNCIMFEWDDLRCLLAVHRHGTYMAAGQALGVNPTTVGRRLASLQEALGATVITRSGRGYVLSDAGLRLLVHAEEMERAALALERTVGGEDGRLEGRVRIGATEMIATRFIAPQLHHFAEAYPHIDVELIAGNDNLDLDRREADIALRLVRPTGDHLVIRRLLQVDLALYAGDRYVKRRGMPSLDGGTDWSAHEVIAFAQTRAFRRENDWLEACAPGARVAFRTNSASTLFAAAVSGVGVALLPRLAADVHPYLNELGPAEGLQPREIWMLIHRDLRHAARIRAVVDFLAEAFRVTTGATH